MRPIPFLAALLVLVAMGMPWFTPQYSPERVVAYAIDYNSTVSNSSLSFVDIVRGLYLHRDEIRDYFHIATKDIPINEILSLITIPLILLGAVIGLFNGKLGHGVGLIGMTLLTIGLLPWGTENSTLSVGMGYLLAWVGFSVGFVSAVGSKK